MATTALRNYISRLTPTDVINGWSMAFGILHREKARVQKRQSNVLRLAEENEKLNAELAAMSERLRAAEARTQALLAEKQRRQQKEGSTTRPVTEDKSSSTL